MDERVCIAIDLKSFYASVECVERGLDPLTTNLVVADRSRTDKTICLAVSPSLKSYGIAGRARLFEVVAQVKKVNKARKAAAPGHILTVKSYDNEAVKADPSIELDYIAAPPQMARYMAVSKQIYGIYLKYIAAEDIHVYSVDEVFIDATSYMKSYGCSPHDLAMKMIRDVLATTGITATAGIGTNLYLAKVAMDIVAKHQEADKDGVRVAQIDEMSYRRLLWSHTPLTDFWRIGRGTAARLQKVGIATMGDIARRSLDPAWEEWFYKTFGVNAELLIDHAWGWEPATMKDIKAYRPSTHSICSGQVLHSPYEWKKGRLILKEMVDGLVMDMVSKGVIAHQMVLWIGYDVECLEGAKGENYTGPIVKDWYGRLVPKPVHGQVNFDPPTSSGLIISNAMLALYDRITDPSLTIRRINIAAAKVVKETGDEVVQLNLFEEPVDTSKERKEQEAILKIRQRFGKNAILRGMNFEEGATAKDRNGQIGGHKA